MIIYDLGCLDQPLVSKIITALAGAFAALATVIGLAALGAFLNRSKRFQAVDIYIGWGAVAAIMTLSAVLLPGSLPFVTLAIFVCMAIAVIPAFKRKYFVAPFWVLAFFPGLFVLVAINIAGITRWDDFGQWVPNAFYLFHYNGVPGRDMPLPHSAMPAYPYGLPFLTYMASWLAGGFLVQGGAMINFLLLIAFAAMLADMFETPDSKPLTLRRFGLTAFAVALVTVGNPAFDLSFSLAHYGETATMVLTAALGLLFWKTLDSLQKKNGEDVRALARQIALIAVALILVKKANMVLLVLLVAGFLIAAAKNRNLKAALGQLPLIILPALALRLIWQNYVNFEIDTGFEIVLMDKWRFELLGPLLHGVWQAIVKDSGLPLMMLAVTIYGAANLFRPPTPLRNFALMTGIVYVGYMVFLVTVYIAADFTEGEVRRAASFYRFSSHTGLLGISTVWMAAPIFWQRVKDKIHRPLPALSPATCRNIVIFLVILLPVIILIKSDWILPLPTPETCKTRLLGQKLVAALPDHARLAILEPERYGVFSFIINLQLDLYGTQMKKDPRIELYMTNSSRPFDRDNLPQIFAQIDGSTDMTTIVVPQAIHDPVTIDGYDNSRGPLVLERGSKGWKPLSF